MQQSHEQLQALTERIDTGLADPDTSRALVVFNQTAVPQSGCAVFHAAMSWTANLPLPPLAVTEADGSVVAASVRGMTEDPDLKGRTDRLRLSFALHFAVRDVPAQGWRTYLASYADVSSPALENGRENADLSVVETTRHGGDLPLTGNF